MCGGHIGSRPGHENSVRTGISAKFHKETQFEYVSIYDYRVGINTIVNKLELRLKRMPHARFLRSCGQATFMKF